MFKIYDELDSPSQGGVLKMYDEPDSPSGACLRYMMTPES